MFLFNKNMLDNLPHGLEVVGYHMSILPVDKDCNHCIGHVDKVIQHAIITRHGSPLAHVGFYRDWRGTLTGNDPTLCLCSLSVFRIASRREYFETERGLVKVLSMCGLGQRVTKL